MAEGTFLTPDTPTHRLSGIEILGEVKPAWRRVFTTDALRFVEALVREFRPRRDELLARRKRVQQELDRGTLPDFLEETREIRESEWTVAAIPQDLLDRRVEITGPADRKMIINALSSGANVFMADFEDSNAPTWENNAQGQANLIDAVNGTIEFTSPEGKVYTLAETIATLVVRPRGWHLDEKHLEVDGKPSPASIVDFAFYFFHNAQTLIAKGSGPYFYLPKLESHLEARLWNDLFHRAQELLGIPQGTIRATVLIETILAAFEMNEILYELREHSAGLNCGRWDYIFSFIKKFRGRRDLVFPDRGLVTMDRHFLRSYSLLLIKTCHRRGIHAMGGMAAQIPIKNDPEANRVAMERVAADKEREVGDGHDGTWVAHPGLVALAKEIFDRTMPAPNQIHNRRDDVNVTAADLLEVPEGPITENGVRQNINVGILYLEAWLGGLGCVPLYNLMEDAATAEISRTQLWQWLHHGAKLDNGRTLTANVYRDVRDQELASIRERAGEQRWRMGKFDRASAIFNHLVLDPDLADFLTLPAYEELVRHRRRS